MSDQARVVIIGGGAVGCAIAYHLAAAGERDVLVLEKAALTHGATWHAAGLVGQLRGKQGLTRLMQNSVALMSRLEQETGQHTGWRQVGSLRVASSPERWQEIRRAATSARGFGLELQLLDVGEAQRLFPLMSTEGVLGAAFIPSDGYIDPYSYTMALAAGARDRGVAIRQGVTVIGFDVAARRIRAVHTDGGDIPCELVVNAAGMWARQIGALAGVSIAAGAVEHQYCVTDKSQDISADLPTFRDPDKIFYLKPEVGGLVIGGWEPNTLPFGEQGIPSEFGRELLQGDFQRFEQVILPAAERIPMLNEVGIQTLINGPIPMSPDGEPIMGLAPELDNFYVACGFTAGIAASGGAGQAMAEWIIDGDPGLDLWPLDIRRFGAHHGSREFLRRRCVEAYGDYYKLHPPGAEMRSARGVRRSALYPMLAGRGAVFGSRFGWERANWFVAEAASIGPESLFSRQRPEQPVGCEHRLVREGVALIDQSSFAKFEISGPGACAGLQWLAANNIDRPPGSVVYTQLCNERGGIAADVTVVRLARDRFYLVTGSGFGVHDRDWIGRHLPAGCEVRIDEVTSCRAVINLCGPRARQVLAKVCDTDLGNSAFPWMSARQVWVGYAPVLALRLTYVGELGWELHMPVEYAPRVYQSLLEAGGEYGIGDVGYHAIDSLRLEKRYLYWGADISPWYTPYEAGLGFCVKLGKGDFLGRAALERQRETGVKRSLCCLLLEPEVAVFGGEAICADGEVVGVTTSGNRGYSVDRAIVLGYLPAELTGRRDFDVEVGCERHPAVRIDGCAYDPERRRILASAEVAS